MPKPRKGGWGLQSVVNGWINVNEHAQHEHAQQSSSSHVGRAGAPLASQPGGQQQLPAGGAAAGSGGGGGQPPPHHLAAGGQPTPPPRRQHDGRGGGGQQAASGRRRSRGGSSQKQDNYYGEQYQQHPAGPAAAGYPTPVPGDGRVILERRRDSAGEGGAAAGGGPNDLKWGPEPVPLSPEASPMLPPSSGPSGVQPPHLGLDASGSRSSHSASVATSAGQTGASQSSASGTSRSTSSSMAQIQKNKVQRKSSTTTHVTMETGELTNSNRTLEDMSSASVSMLSSPYRTNSGLQYDGPASPATVQNILGGRGGPGSESAAAGAVMSSASAADIAASAANHGGPILTGGPRRSSTAYQSSELDYSTSATGSTFGGVPSPYFAGGSRRPSTLTDITASTAGPAAAPPMDASVEASSSPSEPTGRDGGGGDSFSVKSSKSASSTASGRTTKSHSRKKERNALRRTNSQSDLLKVMAGGGSPHVSLEDKSKRRSDAFLRRVHEMQAEQRRRLTAVQEAEELRLQQLHDDPHQSLQQQEEQYYESGSFRSDRASNRSLSVSGTVSAKADSSTSGSATVAHSNVGIGTVGSHSGGSATVAHSNTEFTVGSESRREGSGTSMQAQVLGGQLVVQQRSSSAISSRGDDSSDSSSIQKLFSGILGVGGADEKDKQLQQQQVSVTKKTEPGMVVSNLPSQQQQQQQQQQEQHPASTGQYLNEAAFVQHVQRQRAAEIAMQQQHQQQQGSSSIVSGGTGKKSKKSSKKSSRRRSDDGLPLDVVSAIPTSAPQNHWALYPGLQHQQQQPSPPPPQLPQQQQHSASMRGQYSYGQVSPLPQQQQLPPSAGRGGFVITGPGIVQPHPHPHPAGALCAHCNVLERQMMALQADLEYLRSVILQNEFVCAECEAPGKRGSGSVAGVPSSVASVSSSKSRLSSASRKSKKKYGSSNSLAADADKPHESKALTDASQRLMGVAARHKKQVEHMTKETARWQNDMHLKLSKMSMMCKELNDESSKRKEESVSVQATLAKVRADRNSLKSEVEALKARIALYETEDVENDRVSQALRENEKTGLDNVDDAIKERDASLKSMTSQLGRTLDSLDVERRQLKQRRQIIFPSKNQSQSTRSFNSAQASESSFFNPLLGMTRDAEEGHVDRVALEEAAIKEQSLQARCEKLEKELRVAQEKLRESTAK